MLIRSGGVYSWGGESLEGVEREERVIWLRPARSRPSRGRLSQYELSFKATRKHGYLQVGLYLGAALVKSLGLSAGQRVHIGLRNIRYDDEGHISEFELLIKPAPDGPFVLKSPYKRGKRTGLKIEGLASALREVLGDAELNYIADKINGRRRVLITMEGGTIVAFIRI